MVTRGLRPRDRGPYGVLVGDPALAFRPPYLLSLSSRRSRFFSAAGIEATPEHVVYQMLAAGQLEILRPDESVDLRATGAERFIVFRGDRSFRFLVDDRTFDWGAAHITGATISAPGRAKAHSNDVWQLIPTAMTASSATGSSRIWRRRAGGVLRDQADRGPHHRQRAAARGAQARGGLLDAVKSASEAVPAENTVYTITYARGPHQNPEGSLVAGQRVVVKDAMSFYVTVTDKS
ncbi:MAG: multiubiquitin domain-containing protein [Burkholderiaceae bacterium]|nr:multiubiquitin domain-containing protein [Burkholderiaceae bacterium]